MQIGQVKAFNIEQRNKISVYVRLGLLWFKGGGLRMNGFVLVPFVGLITIDGLSNVGPKIISGSS